MRPELMPPGKTCDGWTVLLHDERGPGRVLAGTGATPLDALKAAYRETAVTCGILAHAVIREAHPDPLKGLDAYTALHRVASDFLAGGVNLEALAAACHAVEVARGTPQV